MLNKFYTYLVGYRVRGTYWSCTEAAHKIQRWAGLRVIHSGSSKEWNDLEKECKEKAPIIYWITDTGFDHAQDVVMFPYDVYRNIKRYIVNRFVDKTHFIKTKLPVGQWYDVETRLLHGIMETLVDFVEHEKAHMYDMGAVWGDAEDFVPIKDRREAGFAYLDWEINLDDANGQDEQAQEVKDLYIWWKDERPKRPDIYEISGWNAYCDSKEYPLDAEMDDDKRANVRKLLSTVAKLEKHYDDEDTEMLNRVIKIRKGLWT